MIFIQIKAVNPPSLIVLSLQPQDLENLQLLSRPWTLLYSKVFYSQVWGHLSNSQSLAKMGSCNRAMIPGTASNLQQMARKKKNQGAAMQQG